MPYLLRLSQGPWPCSNNMHHNLKILWLSLEPTCVPHGGIACDTSSSYKHR